MMNERELLQKWSKPSLWSEIAFHLDNCGLDVKVAYPLDNAAADSHNKTVYLAPVRGPCTFGAALHEIGHTQVDTPEKWKARQMAYLFGMQQDYKENVNREERLAWSWAKHNCRQWTDEMCGYAKLALGSHTAKSNEEGLAVNKKLFVGLIRECEGVTIDRDTLDAIIRRRLEDGSLDYERLIRVRNHITHV
jgi:hypothetical protein